MEFSARNVLKGRVLQILKGAVHAEVTLELPGGAQVVSFITNRSVRTPGLEEGREANAVTRASNVMIDVH